jgi:hypothetical protein
MPPPRRAVKRRLKQRMMMIVSAASRVTRIARNVRPRCEANRRRPGCCSLGSAAPLQTRNLARLLSGRPRDRDNWINYPLQQAPADICRNLPPLGFQLHPAAARCRAAMGIFPQSTVPSCSRQALSAIRRPTLRKLSLTQSRLPLVWDSKASSPSLWRPLEPGYFLLRPRGAGGRRSLPLRPAVDSTSPRC